MGGSIPQWFPCPLTPKGHPMRIFRPFDALSGIARRLLPKPGIPRVRGWWCANFQNTGHLGRLWHLGWLGQFGCPVCPEPRGASRRGSTGGQGARDIGRESESDACRGKFSTARERILDGTRKNSRRHEKSFSTARELFPDGTRIPARPGEVPSPPPLPNLAACPPVLQESGILW